MIGPIVKARLIVKPASVLVLAAAASSCGGEADSTKSTAAVGAVLPGLGLVSQQTAFGDAATQNVTVFCPSSGLVARRLTGTGAETSGAGTTALTSIIPLVNLNGVEVNAARIGGAANIPWSATSHAICAVPPSGLQRVVVTTPSDSSSYKNPTAICPAGKKVLGGGGFISPAAANAVMLSQIIPVPNLNALTAVATEVGAGTNANWSAWAFAICATPPPGLELVSVETGVDSTSPKNQTVNCPAGKKVVGTGAQIASNAQKDIVLVKMIPTATLNGTNAVAIEIGAGTNETWSLKVYAICV